MKKIMRFTLMLAAALLLGACSKEEIPMTNTVALAGEWMMTVDIVDGDEVLENPYGLGQAMFITYNVNDDSAKEMWLDDLGNFWGTRVVIPCSVESMTFGSSTPVDNVDYDPIKVTVTKGKIIPGGTTSPSGMPADAYPVGPNPGSLFFVR